MATDFNTLIRKQRPLRTRRADTVIVPREMELERRAHTLTRATWLTRDDVRDFTTTFALCFTGAMIFFG